MAEEQKPVKSEASDAVQLGEEMSSTTIHTTYEMCNKKYLIKNFRKMFLKKRLNI